MQVILESGQYFSKYANKGTIFYKMIYLLSNCSKYFNKLALHTQGDYSTMVDIMEENYIDWTGDHAHMSSNGW